MKNSIKDKKVFIGVSGGVDSSVSAALLKEQGYDVTGVFIKVWSPDFLPCTWRDERRDAMRVCAALEIPFLTFDFEKEYKKEVVDYMIDEYKNGRTPNPDVMCNKNVKFGAFLNKALEMGAHYVATGHYAVREESGGEYRLLESRDKDKDQSYFLWNLKAGHLKNILFPVGNLKKDEVRALAKKFNLPTAEKKDSQGLCFVGKVDMRDFLKHFIEEKAGSVLNVKGEVIGKHEGAVFYTIGQRHGFSVSDKNSEDKPVYVIEKNIENNTIVVSDKFDQKEKVFSAKKILLENTSWVNSEPVAGKYLCRIRYRQDAQNCYFKKNSVVFDNPQMGVSPGQSLVLYDGELCLGGGIIAEIDNHI